MINKYDSICTHFQYKQFLIEILSIVLNKCVDFLCVCVCVSGLVFYSYNH